MKEKINLLDVVPCKDERIITEQSEDLCVLLLPRFKSKWMQKYMIPSRIKPHVKVTLEEYGTAVWKLINGERTIREIILSLAEHFNYEENYDIRVVTYIDQLKKDGLIKYFIPRQS